MDTTQLSLQRQLADLIANKANLNEIRLVIAQGAKVNLPVVQGKQFGLDLKVSKVRAILVVNLKILNFNSATITRNGLIVAFITTCILMNIVHGLAFPMIEFAMLEAL